MPLPDGFLEELAGRIGIAEVIGKRVKLTRRGRQYLGLCPFHGEKTPSFHVYDDHFHCFGCGAHGSVFDFVMRTEDVGFREAVDRLAAQAGMAVPRASPEAQAREQRRRSLHDVVEAAAAYFQKMLRMPEGKPALDYLRRRGVGDGAVGRFRLGYAPAGRYAVKAALARDGFAEDAMLEAGLLVQPEESQGAYDRFRGRLIFPIGDRRGRPVGFGGRTLGDGEPKYLNSPETPLFHKGGLLYGMDRAAAAARERGTLIVVEGYMDVIGLSEAGWENAVAPLGTALTEDQLRALWQSAPEPILLFDPDPAGERAAARAAERALPLLKPGLGLRFAVLRVDTRDDPDRVTSRYPPQFLQRALAEAAPLSDFLFRIETRGGLAVPAEQRAAVEARLRAKAASVADPTMRSHLLQAFRDRLWQQTRSARQPRSQRGAGPPRMPTPLARLALSGAGAPMQTAISARVRAERTLVAIILNHPAFFHRVEDDLGAMSFAEPMLDRLRQGLVDVLSGAGGLDRAALADALARRDLGGDAADVLDDPQMRTHRLIAPHARPAEVAETWAENLATARRLQAALAMPAETAPDAIIARLRGWPGPDGDD